MNKYIINTFKGRNMFDQSYTKVQQAKHWLVEFRINQKKTDLHSAAFTEFF